MKTIQFNCPNCQQHFEAGAETAGQTIDCPTCSKPFIAPEKWPIWLKILCGVSACVVTVLLAIGTAMGYRYWQIRKETADIFPSVPSETAATPPQKITGAFGYTLGEKLPARCVMDEGGFYTDDENKTNRPFVLIEVMCLSDRTIYEITGAGPDSNEVVPNALRLKYGPGYATSDARGDTYRWTNGNCRLEERSLNNGQAIVTYENHTLVLKRGEEISNARDQAASNMAPRL